MGEFIITADRLSLRRLALSDVEFVIELVNDPDWLRNIGDKQVHCVADAERYLTNGPMALYAKHGVGLWAVVLQGASEPMGMCGLVKRDALEDFDLGFAFLPAYRGQGFALEAARGVLGFVRDELKLKRLAAIVNPDNTSSVKLLEKLGFERTGEMRMPGEAKSVDLFYVHF